MGRAGVWGELGRRDEMRLACVGCVARGVLTPEVIYVIHMHMHMHNMSAVMRFSAETPLRKIQSPHREI